jgi:protein involved in polysaccharide export with SLBB domain
MMVTILMLGVGANADNASIIQAIKANPALLDSPQAKAMIQDAKAPVASKVTKVDIPVNDIVQEEKADNNISNDTNVTEQQKNDEMNSFYRSPLTIEKNSDYSKRLIARQIKESPKVLKRYGIEFFSNKNGMDLASLPVPENYKLVPKDVLNVVLYGPKSDNMSLTIDKDGTVVIPSFGPLQIAGLSFSEAKKTISDALMAAYPNVGVTVNISQFSSIQVTLAGEVAVPGLYNVSSFSTIKEALIAAGGLSANGSMRSVTIKRQGRVFATIDLYTIIRGTGRSDPLLRAGDVIIVPIMGKNVVIDGDVKRPAIYEAKENTTIANLIAYAGGIQASASKNDIRITRYEGHQGMKVLNVSISESEKIIAMDQDKVYVHNLDKSNLRGIALYGNVVKPGFWPLEKDGTPLKEFFGREISQNTLRGVFLEDTYFDYAIIKRTSANLKEELIGFSLSDALSGKEKISLKNRDELYILNRSTVTPPSVVKISGECIARAGEYKFLSNMTLEALLSTAGTTCPIDRSRVTIVSPDPILMTMKVRVVDMMHEKVMLGEFDDIRTVGYFTTNPIKEAKINGEIYKPGSYPIADKATTLNDLIRAAGGLTEKASMDKIELVGYSINNGIRVRDVKIVSVAEATSEASPLLQAYDEVTVFKIPHWNERKSVTIHGKVKYPGEYAIEDGDTMSDVLKRAGGFTNAAYVDGAVFTREELKVRQREGMERQIKDLESRVMYIATQPTDAGQTAGDKSQLISLLGTLKDEIQKTPFVGRLSLNLQTDLRRFEGSSSDILLKNGDSLYVPEREDSVVVQGEVLNPNAIVYNASMSIDDYIEKAGGLKGSADEDNIFIVHANGEAEVIKSGYMFTSGASVGPGDVIVIPMYISTYSGMQLAKDITAIVYQLAVSVAALQTIGAL